MAAAIVSSAYSAWQATLWSGVQATSFAEAGSARTQSVERYGRANQEIAYDAMTFGQLAIEFGDTAEEPETQDRIERLSEILFRDEFRAAWDAWLAQDPAENPEAALTPFDLPEYANASQAEAEEFTELADEKFDMAKEANKNGDDYILNTVVLASVLFFAGITERFRSVNVRAMMIVFAVLVFGLGVWRLIDLPFTTG